MKSEAVTYGAALAIPPGMVRCTNGSCRTVMVPSVAARIPDWERTLRKFAPETAICCVCWWAL